jgi:hypothetical protein
MGANSFYHGSQQWNYRVAFYQILLNSNAVYLFITCVKCHPKETIAKREGFQKREKVQISEKVILP